MAQEKIDSELPGYSYGAETVQASPVTLHQLNGLKITVGFTDEDHRFLRMAGEVLSDQTEHIVNYWRSNIIASIPNLARHSRSPAGEPLAKYLAQSNLRFRQWILDTCFRPYDQDWLNYQHEIALRHTSIKKNKVDAVSSTTHVPFRDITAFIAVMNDTMKAFLSAKGHQPSEIEAMHRAWCKSLQLQLALWAYPYNSEVRGEW